MTDAVATSTSATTVAGPEPGNRKDSAEARKIELECQLLEQQLSPRHQRRETLRLAAGASGLVLAAITLIGGLLSIASWFYEANKSRELRVEERIDRALQLLAESRSNQRMSAVVSLRSFLDRAETTQTTQALLSLTNALAVENEKPVQNAILGALDDIRPEAVGRQTLDRALRSLTQVSRGLANESDLWRKRPDNLFRLEEDLPAGGRLQVSAHAMAILLRKGARAEDMTGVYLGREDLAGLDLSGTRFDDSILAWSDFSGSKLFEASFNGADLENVRFVSADLRRAKLTFLENDSRSAIRWDYVERQMNRSQHQVQASNPDFSCADLREANFSGHALFAMVPDDVPEFSFVYFPPKFAGANLEAADFSSIRTFGVRKDGDYRSPFFVRSSSGSRPKESELVRYAAATDAEASLSSDRVHFTKSLQGVSFSLSGSNWNGARFSKALGKWLEENPPPIAPVSEDCRPKAPW